MSHMTKPQNHRKKLMDEALTVSQRIKRSRIMKMKGKLIARKRAISMKRRANSEQLQKRALKKARGIVAKKFMGGKTRDEMGFGELEALEKKVGKKKSVIKKIAKRILPQIKKDETERLAKLRSKK